MFVQQSRWFQHLPEELYEYSGTKLSQGCSAMHAKIVFACPKDEDSSKATLTSRRGRKKDRNRVGIEKSREQDWFLLPA